MGAKMVKGYITTSELMKRYGCSSRTIFRWMKRETNPFPQPRMKASGAHNRWALDDIEKWEDLVNVQQAA